MNLYYLIQSTDKFEGKKIDPFGSTVSFPDIVFEEGSTAWNGEKISIEVFTSLEEARKVFETKKTKQTVSGDFLQVWEWLIESYELTVDDKDIESVIETIKKNPYIQNEYLKYDGIEDCTHRTFKAYSDYEDENIRFYYKKGYTQTRVDSKKLKEENPKLFKKYSKTTTAKSTFALELKDGN